MTLPGVLFVSDAILAPDWKTGFPRDKADDADTIELEVDPVIDAIGYIFYGSETPGFTPGPGNELSDQVGESFDHTPLDLGDTWYYRARGKATHHLGPLGVEASATVLPVIPGIPTVSAARVGAAQIDVTISAGSPDTADDYGLQRQERVCGGSYGAWSTIDASASAGVYNDGAVLEGSEYNYRARGQNAGGNSDYSSESSAAAYDTPVTGAWTATYPKTGTPAISVIDWSFVAGTGTVDGYDVRWRVQGGSWPGTPQLEDTTDLSGSFTGMADDTTFELEHRARNDCGGFGSWSATGNATTDLAPPADPPVVSASPQAATDSIINVSCTVVADADDYDFEWSSVADSGPWNTLGSASDRTIDHTGLSPDTRRWYRARATNAGGNGPWSTPGVAAATHVETPQNFNAVQDEGECPAFEVLVSWDDDNQDGDARDEARVIQRDDGAGYATVHTTAAGDKTWLDTGALDTTEGYRGRYSSEGTYATPKLIDPECPE